MLAYEPVYRFCEHFHLWCGLPFLCRELWHVGGHVVRHTVKKLIKRGIK